MSQLSVDSITGRVAGTSPTFPNGFNVTGVVTATVVNQNITGATSFQGSTTFDNGFTVSGATGIITATGFSGPLTGAVTGDVTGNLTGNVTGTATTATNAQGLTGTPSITVTNVTGNNGTFSGDVTGVNATFSGNLTVQGTTTTIDTAVTAVDSLAVDGSVGIGTTNPNVDLHLHDSTNTRIQFTDDSVGAGAGDGVIIGLNGDDDFFINNRESGKKLLLFTNNIERVQITGGGTAIFKAGLAEKYNTGTTLAAASNNVALTSGNVHRFTSNESGAQTVNFTGVHSTLADGESVSFTVIVTPANSGYINAATVDGVAPGGGLKWSGGSAPSSGGSSGRDVYTFTIFKAGTATDSYEIFGAVTNYA